MMNKYHKTNRIRYLEEKYSETNIAQGEILSKETKYKINHNYQKTQKRRIIDSILLQTNNPNTIKEEVHNICEEVDDLKRLCRTCSIEQIVTVIILYVQRLHNPRFVEEERSIWRKYQISWKMYGKIMANLLRETRRNRRL